MKMNLMLKGYGKREYRSSSGWESQQQSFREPRENDEEKREQKYIVLTNEVRLGLVEALLKLVGHVNTEANRSPGNNTQLERK